VSKQGDDFVSVKIDDSFFMPSATDPAKKCLVLGVITGDIDCKYWLSDGLAADVAAAKQYSNKALRSAVRAKTSNWAVEAGMMPDETQPYSHDFAEVCFFHLLFIPHITHCCS